MLNRIDSTPSSIVALIIGVSRYESKLIDDLSYSSDDAVNFSNALADMGINRDNIFILTNEEATRQNILNVLCTLIPRMLNSSDSTKKIIFYFSGHGYRSDPGVSGQESVLLCSDTDAKNKLFTGLRLSDIMGGLSRSCADEIYLFIDACSAHLDKIENIFTPQLSDKEVLTLNKAKSLLCFVASGLGKAYEDETKKSGLFTDSIINNMIRINESGGGSEELVKLVVKDFENNKLQHPEFYFYGQKFSWFLPYSMDVENGGLALRAFNDELTDYYINRHKIQAALNNSILNSFVPLYIYGKSGIGKTTIIRHVSQQYKSVYISIPNNNCIDILGLISGEIATQLIEVFPSGKPLEDINCMLEQVTNNYPLLLLVIDHLERISSNVELIVTSCLKKGIKLVLISREILFKSTNIEYWQCPELSDSEIVDFLNEYGGGSSNWNLDLVIQNSQRLPIGIRKLVLNTTENIFTAKDYQNCVLALNSTGGYVDERIFKQTFDISSAIIDDMLKNGQIVFLDNKFIPHDTIVDHAYEINRELAATYWVRQVNQTPTNVWACTQLIHTITNSTTSIKLLKNVPLPSLVHAVNIAFDLKKWELLESLGNIIIKHNYNQIDCLLKIARIFVHKSDCIYADKVKHFLQLYDLNCDQRITLQLIEAERSWWLGNYDVTEDISKMLLEKENITEEIQYECKLNLGLAEFFRGNWDLSINHFSFINDVFNLATPLVNGWALYLTGTILGLRGTDIQKGKQLFYSGIRLLESSGDTSGAAIAWGNLSEMSWKLREYDIALIQSNKAYNYAVVTNNIFNQIENMRNQIHIYLRKTPSDFDKVLHLIDKVSDLLIEDMGATIYMQVWNTFATAYAYMGNLLMLEDMLNRAFDFTVNNEEYHIYTLGNSCLRYLILGDFKLAQKDYDESIEKALKGNNYLAIRQINDDIIFVNSSIKTKTTHEMILYIQNNVVYTENKLLESEV